jgi:hypothetical protein
VVSGGGSSYESARVGVGREDGDYFRNEKVMSSLFRPEFYSFSKCNLIAHVESPPEKSQEVKLNYVF